MKKVFGFVFTILLLAVLLYIFLLSPSQDETAGDQHFSKKEFRVAIVFYTKALANHKTTFSEERILFKLGNSYRLAGENQRAFDFYFSILRKNEASVYRTRIQAYLRHEAKDLEMETSIGEIELESISSNKLVNENILELKKKRDKLYLKLLHVLTQSVNQPGDYRLLDLYDSYTNIQTKYLNRRQFALTEVKKEREKKISKRFVSLWMDKLGLDEFSSLSDRYRIEHIAVEDWTECFEIKSDLPVDAFFINVSEKVHTNLSIQLSRLYDFHEKAKVFLVFDDNTSESLLQKTVKTSDESVSLLQCGMDNDCAKVIRQLIHRRSIWQSDG